MNEREFARSILATIQEDSGISRWYEANLRGQDFAETIAKLQDAIRSNNLTTDEALILACFIGFSHTLESRTKQQ